MSETADFAQHEYWRRLRISFLLLFALLYVGTMGFYLLGDNHTFFECIYLTAVILTTVGMKAQEIQMNAPEQGWALVLMLGGISLALYAATNLVAFVVEGELTRTFGRRHLQKRIEKLDGHTVIVGFGRTGRALCASLKEHHQAFVLIECDTSMVQQAEELDYLCIQGDAVDEDTLVRASLARAAGMVCCLPREADNVFVTLKAREYNTTMTVIARGQNVENEPMLKRAGANRVIVPPVLAENQVLEMLTAPVA